MLRESPHRFPYAATHQRRSDEPRAYHCISAPTRGGNVGDRRTLGEESVSNGFPTAINYVRIVRLSSTHQPAEPVAIRTNSRVSKRQPFASGVAHRHIAPTTRQRRLFSNQAHRKSTFYVVFDYFGGLIG